MSGEQLSDEAINLGPVKTGISPRTLLALIWLTVGWLGIEMAMALDVTQFPIILERALHSNFLVGIVMGLGPLAGLTIQPWMGYYGDVLVQRGISRDMLMRYGTLLGALALVGLGLVKHTWAIVVFMAIFFIATNVVMVSYRAYVTQASQRKALYQQKGVISGLMGLFSGLGALVMAIICGVIAQYSQYMLGLGQHMSFLMGAMFFLVVMGLFFEYAPKPQPVLTLATDEGDAQAEAILQSRALFSLKHILFYAFPPLALIPAFERQLVVYDYQKSIFRLFVVLFFSWIGLQALRGYFVLFVEKSLGMQIAEAQFLLALTTLVMVLAAVPLGKLADHWDIRQLFKVSLILFSGVSALAFVLVHGMPSAIVMCVLFGVSLAGLVVCPLSLLFQLCPRQQEGTYSGLYNVFISMPQLYSLLITGALIDLCHSHRIILVVAGLASCFAIGCVLRLPQTSVQSGRLTIH